MLPALLIAATCAGWHAGVTGYYPGEVESRGIKPIDTWIEDTPAGLSGHYVLHEPERDVPGTLEALGDVECGVAQFRWTDLYGSGVARLRFDLDRHCFDGNWGNEQVLAALVWRACTRTRVTS